MLYFIGMDGGGTKTEAAVLFDGEGEPAALVSGCATNPYAVGRDAAVSELGRILDEVCGSAALAGGRCAGICLGLAGVDSDEERRAILQAMEDYQKERGIRFPVALRGEAEISLMAALGKEYGILVISGTGSGVYGNTAEGLRFRAGGWGHLLGDEGSGYRIGQLSLQAAMKSHDGIYPSTSLVEKIVTARQFSRITDLKAYVYGPGIQKRHIAAFAELCIEAAAEGDEVADRILISQARELAETTEALIAKHPSFSQESVVLAGSIFAHCPLFAAEYTGMLLARFPGLTFHAAGRKPAVGAAMLARRLFGAAGGGSERSAGRMRRE